MPSNPNRSPLRFSLASLLLAMVIVSIYLAAYHMQGDQVFPIWLLITSLLVAGYGFLRRKRGLAWSAVILALFGLLPSNDHRNGSARSSCSNNLKQLALAAHIYHDINMRFPAARGVAPPGSPLVSWRVHLLPYLERDDLYERYNLKEPWNAPSNGPLLGLPIAIYRCPLEGIRDNHETSYVAIVGDDTCWPASQGISLANIDDGSSNTLLFVERHNSGIAWSEPRDLDASSMAWGVNASPEPSISSRHGMPTVRYFDGSRRFSGSPNGAHVALADGSVRYLQNDIDPEVVKQLANRRDGQPEAGTDW